MKEAQKQVQADYESGKLRFSDIDMGRLTEMTWKAVTNALAKAGKEFKVLEEAVEGELKNDLSALGEAGKKVGDLLGGLFGGGR